MGCWGSQLETHLNPCFWNLSKDISSLVGCHGSCMQIFFRMVSTPKVAPWINWSVEIFVNPAECKVGNFWGQNINYSIILPSWATHLAGPGWYLQPWGSFQPPWRGIHGSWRNWSCSGAEKSTVSVARCNIGATTSRVSKSVKGT